MLLTDMHELFSKIKIINESFGECKDCLKEIHSEAKKIINIPYEHNDFEIKLDKFPDEFFTIKRNLFSSLFQSMYVLLNIQKPRRILYGKINYLFRIWVTSVDNLLDNENKMTLPLIVPKNSRVIKESVSIMVADRVLANILSESVEIGLISLEESKVLLNKSLQILLPSAGEEATEENGILERKSPDYTLNVIHKLKTGILFQVPFLGPESIEKDININILNKCKDGLYKFGLGCQLLDDIRDISRDFLENRHNYILSRIYFEKRNEYILKLQNLKIEITSDTKIFYEFEDIVSETSKLAIELLKDGIFLLNEAGLGFKNEYTKTIIIFLFTVLDLGDLWKSLKIKI